MKTITVRNVVLQFDGDQVTSGDKRYQAGQAIDLINTILQREPFGLGAQITWAGASPSQDVEVGEDERE